jgi:hypothetical protein
MILSRRAHNEVVALLQAQIRELRAERDFWRARCVPEATILAPMADRLQLETRSEVVEPAPIDAGWTADDRAFFAEWARENVAPGIDPLKQWQHHYGNQPPLCALVV